MAASIGSFFVNGIAISPDGRLVATADTGQTVRLFQASDGKQIRAFSGHQGYATSVAFSPDGRWLTSCGYDGTIRLWKPEAQAPVEKTKFGGDRRWCFSPDGRWLAGWQRPGAKNEGKGALLLCDLHASPAAVRLLDDDPTAQPEGFLENGTVLCCSRRGGKDFIGSLFVEQRRIADWALLSRTELPESHAADVADVAGTLATRRARAGVANGGRADGRQRAVRLAQDGDGRARVRGFPFARIDHVFRGAAPRGDDRGHGEQSAVRAGGGNVERPGAGSRRGRSGWGLLVHHAAGRAGRRDRIRVDHFWRSHPRHRCVQLPSVRDRAFRLAPRWDGRCRHDHFPPHDARHSSARERAAGHGGRAR